MNTIHLSRSMNNNLTQITLGGTTLWFSYETIVAFQAPGGERIVSENVWSNTTGRHLSDIDGGSKSAKSERLPHAQFTKELDKVMAKLDRALTPRAPRKAA